MVKLAAVLQTVLFIRGVYVRKIPHPECLVPAAKHDKGRLKMVWAATSLYSFGSTVTFHAQITKKE
jgi:hypothetical protein